MGGALADRRRTHASLRAAEDREVLVGVERRRFNTRPGGVLSERSLSSRATCCTWRSRTPGVDCNPGCVSCLLASRAPERLTVETYCESITEGGADRIEEWLGEHPDARLVVVDVLARVRAQVGDRTNRYDNDYAVMALLEDLADRWGVAFLVVHHTRKASSEDFLDSVSGTQGIAGAADAVLVLARSRGNAEAVLKVTGRDVEEAEYALNLRPISEPGSCSTVQHRTTSRATNVDRSSPPSENATASVRRRSLTHRT